MVLFLSSSICTSGFSSVCFFIALNYAINYADKRFKILENNCKIKLIQEHICKEGWLEDGF